MAREKKAGTTSGAADVTEERESERGDRPATAGDRKGRPTPSRDGRATKQSPPARFMRFLREVVAELRKVIWPNRKDLVAYTVVVLVFVSFMMALVAGLDAVFAKAVFAVFGNG
jgi:preprotein translocase subunit SecE